jgi:hypothetical protein
VIPWLAYIAVISTLALLCILLGLSTSILKPLCPERQARFGAGTLSLQVPKVPKIHSTRFCSAEGASQRPKCGPGNGAFDCLPAVRDAQPVPRRAIATFLQNDQYLASALTLAYSLRQHGNGLPLVMFTIEGLGQLSPVAVKLAECAGWQIRMWKNIEPYKATTKQFHHMCAFCSFPRSCLSLWLTWNVKTSVQLS